MKILFLMLNPGYVRLYGDSLRELAARGHRIHIAYQVLRNKMGENSSMADLVRDWPNVTADQAVEPEDGLWRTLARTVRGLLDYIRYLDPRYAQADALRERMAVQLPAPFLRLARLVSKLGAPARRLFISTLLRLEWCVPRSPAIARFLDEHEPDVLLVTPLVEPFSTQVDYVKEAAYRGLPSALCVASWDNLTNKGLVRVAPTRVLLWNEAQRAEARDLHGVPADRIVVTGAQVFDPWFTWKPARSRDQFLERVGLDPAKPFILYLGSSYFIAPNEAEFVDRWIAGLRRLETPLGDYGVLVRPHPTNAQQFLGMDLSVFRNVAIWPPFNTNFLAQESREDFFDSLYYSAAAVGVNTSALIEASIVGRSVCTILAPDFAHSQEGTLHFQLLAGGDTPLLRVASTFDEHFRHLAEAVAPTADMQQRIAGFVNDFVRPHGLEKPAGPILADAIEQMQGLQVPARSTSVLDPYLRVLVAAPTLLAGVIWRRWDRQARDPIEFTRWLAIQLATRWARYQAWLARMSAPQPAPALETAPGLQPAIALPPEPAGAPPLVATKLLKAKPPRAAKPPREPKPPRVPKPIKPRRQRDEASRQQHAAEKLRREQRRQIIAARRAAEEQERAAKLRAFEQRRSQKDAERRRKTEDAVAQRRHEPFRSRLPLPLRARVNQSRLAVHRFRKRATKMGTLAIERTRRAGRRTIRRLRHVTALIWQR